MGEAKRRRAARITALPTRHEIEQGFRTIQAEGGGVYEIMLCSPHDAPGLLSKAQAGDRIARTQLDGIERMLNLVERNSPDAPLCLLCGAEFRSDRLPVLFGFLHAHRDDPTQMVANTICRDCFTQHPTREAMGRAVTDYYRAHIISDLRVLPQLSEAGHA